MQQNAPGPPPGARLSLAITTVPPPALALGLDKKSPVISSKWRQQTRQGLLRLQPASLLLPATRELSRATRQRRKLVGAVD